MLATADRRRKTQEDQGQALILWSEDDWNKWCFSRWQEKCLVGRNDPAARKTAIL